MKWGHASAVAVGVTAEAEVAGVELGAVFDVDLCDAVKANK